MVQQAKKKKTGVKLISDTFFFVVALFFPSRFPLHSFGFECLFSLQHHPHGRPGHQKTVSDIASSRGHPALHPSDAVGSAHATDQRCPHSARAAHGAVDVDRSLQDEPHADPVDALALPTDAWDCAHCVPAADQVLQSCCCQFVVLLLLLTCPFVSFSFKLHVC